MSAAAGGASGRPPSGAKILLTTLARRLAVVPLTLFGITLVTFALLHALPGDAVLVQAGTSRGASPESLAAMRHQYGLDRPLPAQYADWLARSARLDFGDSLVDGRPVRAKIAAALPTTLALALLAAALAFGVAVPLGAALGWFDRRALGARLVGRALRLLRPADRRGGDAGAARRRAVGRTHARRNAARRGLSGARRDASSSPATSAAPCSTRSPPTMSPPRAPRATAPPASSPTRCATRCCRR